MNFGVQAAASRAEEDKALVEYRRHGAAADTVPGWRFEIIEWEIRLISQLVGNGKAGAAAFELRF